ncbi:2762_t:CDS:2, partial [Funneliformis mosseae]
MVLEAKNIDDGEEIPNHLDDDLKKYNIVIGNYLFALYYYREII